VASAHGGGAPGPGLLLEGAGGTAFLSPQQIREASAAEPSRTYTLRAAPGEADETVARRGLAVRRVLALGGFDPGGYSYLTVPRADGTTAYLPASDFSEPPPFPEGPVLVWVDVDSTHFFRPVLGPEDANAADNLATPSGEALRIGLHDGALLHVFATDSNGDPARGETVSFSASASGALPGERLSYRWSFGDGGFAEGGEVTHSFSSAGTYEVAASALGSSESGGEAAPLRIVVGDPPQHRAAAAATPGGTKPNRVSGNGTIDGGGGAGPAGGGTPGGGTPGGEHRGPSDARGRGGSSASGSGDGAAPSTAPAAASAAAGGAQPAHSATPSSSSPAQTVSGVLVADLRSPARSNLPADSGASSGEASSPSAPPGGAGTVPLAAVLVAALLGAGALLEWRGHRLRVS
jgi:hypothetical protein